MQTTLYLARDKNSGFGINPDGTLISVFSLYKKRGPNLVGAAVQRGAKRVECLGEKLRGLYENAGFEIMLSAPWNENLAPPNWNYNQFGQPNYYELEMLDNQE